MAPSINSPKQPIAIRHEYIASRATSLHINQHSLSWSGGDFGISESANDENGPSQEPNTLFTVNGKIATLTQRHQFLDESGLPLFDITRKMAGVTWFVRLPGGGSSCEPIATIAPRWSYFKDKFDVYISNAAMDGEEVVIEARGQDIWKLRTNFYVNGALVMTSKRTDKLTPYIPGKRPEWHMEVAKGVDLSLASVLSVYLAELLFHSCMPSSHNSLGGTQGSPSEPFKSESKAGIN